MDIQIGVDEFLVEDVAPQALSTPLPDDMAAEVVERLKQEADRYAGIDPNRSLDLARRIVAIGQARGDARQTALGLMAQGDALKFIGRTAEAWEALEQAGRIYREAGDDVGWARTCIGRLYLSTMLQCVPETLAEAERARQIFKRFGERDKLLRLELQTGYVYNFIGDHFKALDSFRAALVLAEALGETGRHHFGLLYWNVGSAFEGLGDLRQAQDYYERAHALFRAEGETLRLASVEANLGYLAQAQGNYRRALQLLNRSLERAEGHSDLETTKIKWHLLDCYLGLNRRVEARDLARQIVAELRQLNDALGLGYGLLQQAMIEAELGSIEVALAALDEADGLFSSLGAASWEAMTRLRRGRIALKRGDLAAAYARSMDAAAVFKSVGQQVNFATASLLQGQACLALEDYSCAAAAAGVALRTAQRDHVPSLRYTAHLLLGQIYEARNSLQRAARHYGAAAATLERVQRGLTITLRPGFLEDKADAWRALIGLYLRTGRIGEAFETLERAKSQVLLGYLVNREGLRWAWDNPSSRTLIEKLERLRAEHQWFYRLAHEEPLTPDHHGQVDPQQALSEVKARERSMRAITEQLYLQGAENRAANPAQTPSLGDVKGTLDGGALMVEYYNDGGQLWAFSLDRDSIEVQQLPVKPEELNQLLAQLQLNLTAALKVGPQNPAAESLTRLAQRILQRLYASLVGPLAHRLEGRQRLVVVPYGALHYMPFHLLYDGQSYLIERVEVVVLPAAGLATRTAPQREPGALILAHSWEGRLPYTLTEGQLVQDLFGGSCWSEQAAVRAAFQAQPTQILHIAAHGRYRLDQPDLSYIQLADGQLFADDLLQQDLSYELVTLSACETGRANVAGGDELIGLGRGFLYAGAGALILSLWPVVDTTTLHLMERMYLALQRGASKAAALQDAQKGVLAEDPRLHPAFWGAFQLVGNASPLSNRAG